MWVAYEMFERHISKYRDLLSRAVVRLPHDSPDLRRELYQRARAALRNQLRAIQPPISDVNIFAEERALNEAIERIEANAKVKGALTLVGPVTEARNGCGGGTLSDLLKRASREPQPAIVSQAHLPRPISPMDFAPRRAQIKHTSIGSQSHLLVTSLQESERSVGAAKEPPRTKPVSRRENLCHILHKFRDESPGVEASAVISEDGLMIASAFAANMEEARISGLAATLLNVGERAATVLARGATREVIIRGNSGYAILVSAGRGALLLALANESSKLGLIFFNIQEAIKALPAAMEARTATFE